MTTTNVPLGWESPLGENPRYKVFHFVMSLHLVTHLVCWVFQLFPMWGYYKERCYEHSCRIFMSINMHFLLAYSSESQCRCVFSFMNTANSVRKQCALFHFRQQHSMTRACFSPVSHAGRCRGPWHFGFDLSFSSES